MEWMQIVAERQIKEAMDNGEFENLPGKGRPLDLDEDMSIPAHQRAVMRILKNSNALPEWIQAEKDIEREMDGLKTLRERGIANLGRVRTAEAYDRSAVRLRADVLERVRLVNTLILHYNHIAPMGYQKTYIPYAVGREQERLDADIAQVRRPTP